LSYISEHTA